MKITIETTIYKPTTKATVEVSADDLDIYQVVDQLIIPVLKGYGFGDESISNAIEGYE